MKLIYLLSSTLFLAGTVGVMAHVTFAQSPKIQITNSAAVKQQSQQVKKQTSNTVGGLYVQSQDKQKQVFPLKHTEVKAKISGNVSRVEVTQTFTNPFKQPLEAVYVFPLPDEAAVDDMEIKIGDKIIKGDIKKREEAKEIYERARQQGQTAGLLEQERDNIFTQSLANIKPGEQIDVTIRYTDSLKFAGGDYEFVFPMVVGPRYIPERQIDNRGNTNQVPDASRITPPVIKPGTRSGHDINVTVDIDAGVELSDIRSTSHQIEVLPKAAFAKVVKLKPEDTIPNKDFILRYRVSGEKTQATVLTQADELGGHFAVYLIPAVEYRSNEIVPKDVVFLMDTSGSQQGEPLAKSQELMRRFINGLNPNDTFTIIDFANTTQQLSPTPLANTAANRTRAINYINQLDANGGTELLNGMRAVLNFPATSAGRLRSIVLLTDGYIGNENQVISEVQRNLKPGNRLYSFGVGSSVNRFLLNRLAEVGRGTSQVIRQDEPTAEVTEKFFRQINNPVLTNIQVSWIGEGKTAEIYPLAAPDLFANQPLVLFGRKQDKKSGKLRITGIAANENRYEKILTVNFTDSGNAGISQLWGRAKIKDLMNQMFGSENPAGVEAVTNTALAYRLLSQYTAFVAVSQEVRVDPDGTRRRVEVPVELPQGVSYEGIFGEAEQFSTTTKLSGNVMFSGGDVLQMRLASPTTRGPVPVPSSRPAAVPPPAPANRIQVVSADKLDRTAIATLNQYLQKINIPAGVGGELVLELPVNNGSVGEIVLDEQSVTINDDATARATLATAKANLAQAKLKYQRYKQLSEEGAITSQMLQEVESQLQQAQLEMLRALGKFAPVIDQIKQSLTTWTPPQSVSGKIRMKLRVLS